MTQPLPLDPNQRTHQAMTLWVLLCLLPLCQYIFTSQLVFAEALSVLAFLGASSLCLFTVEPPSERFPPLYTSNQEHRAQKVTSYFSSMSKPTDFLTVEYVLAHPFIPGDVHQMRPYILASRELGGVSCGSGRGHLVRPSNRNDCCLVYQPEVQMPRLR